MEGAEKGNRDGEDALNWMRLVHAVSELTKLNWTQCYELPIYTFLAYATYNHIYLKEQERMMEEQRRKMKIR